MLLRGAARIGDVLQPARGERDRAQRVPNVVADNRENPLLEVVGESQLRDVLTNGNIESTHTAESASVSYWLATACRSQRPFVLQSRDASQHRCLHFVT